MHLLCCARLLRRPDVLYIGGAGGGGLYFQLMPVVVARLLRVPVVFHHHNSAYLDAHSRPMAILCRLTGGRSVQIALSHRMAEQLTQRYAGRRRLPVVPLSNAIFVPEPADEQRQRDGRPRRPGAPVRLGHVSNLSMDKGMPELLDTASALAAAGLAFELHVAGEPRDDRTRELLEGLRALPGVTVHGALYGSRCRTSTGSSTSCSSPVTTSTRRPAGGARGGQPWRAEPHLPDWIAARTGLLRGTLRTGGEFAVTAAELVRRWDDLGGS